MTTAPRRRKDIKPKVNPKLQRLKRMPVEELERAAKAAARKAVTKAAKAVKMHLVLRCTKRISALKKELGETSAAGENCAEDAEKDEEEDSDTDTDTERETSSSANSNNKSNNNSNNNSDKREELRREVDKLRKLKAIDHLAVGEALALRRFATVFAKELSDRRLRANRGTHTHTGKEGETDAEPAEELLQQVASHAKFAASLGNVDSEVQLLLAQRDEKLRKEQNVLNAQAVTKKPASLGKSAAHTAIFVGSLQAESEGEDDGDSDREDGDEDEEIERRRAKWRMEKAERNRQNREQNKTKREQGSGNGNGNGHGNSNGNERNAREPRKGDLPKTDLSMYMPVNQRQGFKDRASKRPNVGNNKGDKGKVPNRAERRKQLRDQPNTGSFAESDRKDVSESVESAAKKPRIESTHQEERPMYRRDRQAQAQQTQNAVAPVTAAPAKRNNHHNDLTQCAVVGKEWKETGFHPSWAAKQINKPQIVQGQGKKITFDD